MAVRVAGCCCPWRRGGVCGGEVAVRGAGWLSVGTGVVVCGGGGSCPWRRGGCLWRWG
ncbi:hypothetical protein [Bartonella tribocorum]|uniref:hypothetical protein n=1 Tax=Bartonella tribocorum TaxID=85701 RepID=UPI00030B28E0|nr:hypothetical protein [Bartonella tribocorum]